MDLFLTKKDNDFSLKKCDYIQVEYDHREEDPAIDDNDKALLFGRYRMIADYIRAEYKQRPCTLFADSTLKDTNVFAGVENTMWQKYGDIPRTYQDMKMGVPLLTNNHVLIHKITIITYMQEKTYGLSVDFEWIKSHHVDVNALLRQHKIDSLFETV